MENEQAEASAPLLWESGAAAACVCVVCISFAPPTHINSMHVVWVRNQIARLLLDRIGIDVLREMYIHGTACTQEHCFVDGLRCCLSIAYSDVSFQTHRRPIISYVFYRTRQRQHARVAVNNIDRHTNAAKYYLF